MTVTGIESVATGGAGRPWEVEDSAAGEGRGFGQAIRAALDAAGQSPAASTVQQNPVGGSRWLEARAATLFNGSREIIGKHDGLPVVAATPEEAAEGKEYLLSQAQYRGQDPADQSFITVRVPVYAGAFGPTVGYYETQAMRIDLDLSKAVLLKDGERIAAPLE